MTNTRRILVTGGSRGIGRSIATELGRAGFDVAINFRSREDAALEVRQEIEDAGGTASLLGFDIADRAAAAAALEADVKERGAFWGVIANAGVTADGLFASMDGESWDRVLHTNLDGFYNVVQPLVMPMVRLRDGGRVIAMSSVTGIGGNPGQVNYAASKAGLIGAVKALAKELAKRKIAINAVAPGFIETDMVAELPQDQMLAQVPMQRLGKPEEVAALVRFLCSDSAAYITGQAISINGGMV